jgi:4-amino-4-deoxy-L-arabinose transferase-like glycosyltransferase
MHRLKTVRPELVALISLAAVLNLWGLSRNGWANDYYAAAVRSMASSWHDFLYGSFDASGVMTVDKPPLALWVQALSVRIFGYHPLSMLVPQALMGIATVALVYDLVRRRFGRLAGGVAGLVLATTPVFVAVSRHNNPDALLTLLCVAALWCVVRGLEDGRTRWLLAAGAIVGLGFETKMGAALLVVPALATAWLWVAPGGRRAAMGQLAAGAAVMAAVGLAWPLLIALTPAASRPWVSGTADNSIWSLIFGYNGLGRLNGQAGGPQAFGGGGGGPGGGALFGGPTGPLRLVQSGLGGQAGWLLGLAFAGGLALVVTSRLRRTDARTGWLIATGGSFATIAIAFSAAKGIFHPYYVSLLAPFTGALAGAAAAQIHAGGTQARVLAPLALAAGAVTEVLVIHKDATNLQWAVPVILVVGLGAAAVLAIRFDHRVRTAVAGVALAVLLAAPAAWSAQTLGHATNGTFPAGGPASVGRGGPGGGRPGGGQGGFRGGGPRQGGPAMAPSPGAAPGAGGTDGRGGGGGRDGGSLTAALAYIEQHGGGTLGVSSQSGGASQAIIESGADVAGLGGFSGRETQVSTAWLADAVASGRIRWVLADAGGRGGGGPGADGRVGANELMTVVASTCTPVTTESGTLYDCQGQAAALAATAGL